MEPDGQLPELRLAPLDRDASLTLLAHAAPDLAPPVAGVLAEAAAGNPLALVELERAAGAAAARRGFAAAAAAMERAASLSCTRQDVARRMLAAAEAAAAAGLTSRALALLEHAAGAAGDSDLRTVAVHRRGLILAWNGRAGSAIPLLLGEAERTAPRDPKLAAMMLADAAGAATATNAYERALALGERAALLLSPGDDAVTRGHVLASLGWARLLCGHGHRAREALDEAERLAADLDPLAPGRQWMHLLQRSRVPAGEFERALRDGLALAQQARGAGALAALGGALIVAADAAFRLGDWGVSDAATAEAIAVAEDTGQGIWLG